VTWPGPPPDRDLLHTVARWCADLADVLTEVGVRVGRLAEQIGHDWPDDLGREWAGRAVLVRGELGRDAASAAELGAAALRSAEPDADGPTPFPAPGAGAGRGTAPRAGMRLGGTAASRVEDDRGIRIAELPVTWPGPAPG
jgi:hypothetical protein